MTDDREGRSGPLPPPPGHDRRDGAPEGARPGEEGPGGRDPGGRSWEAPTGSGGPAGGDQGRGSRGYGVPGAGSRGYGAGGDGGPGAWRAMTLAEVLDGMFRLIRDHWKAFLFGVGGVLVPLTLLSNVLLAAIAPDLIVPDVEGLLDPQAAATGELPFDGEILVALGAVTLLGFLITTPITWAVCTVVAGEAIGGGQPVAGDAVRRGVRRFLPVLGVFVLLLLAIVAVVTAAIGAVAGVVAAVGNAGGLVAVPLILVVFGLVVWMYVRWALAVPAAVLERAGPFRALRRSWQLTRGRFWWLFGTLLLVQVVAILIASIAATPFQAVSLGLRNATFAAALVTSIGSVVSGLISTPLQVNALTLLYSDRRVRVEGADLTAGTSGSPDGSPGSSPDDGAQGGPGGSRTPDWNDPGGRW